VFVLYATSCSNSIAGKANRKTIQGQDVVSAMEDMEFDKFIKPLETSLQGMTGSLHLMDIFRGRFGPRTVNISKYVMF